MRACVLHGVGDLRCEDVAVPRPGPGQVLVRVTACGVCGSDVPRIFAKGTYRFPTIPGHEFAGEIVTVGPDADASLIGKRVTVYPLIPCRKCAACAIGAFAMCEDYDYLGSRCDGAFAEYVCAPAWNVVAVPDTVSFEEAAMTEPAAVAAHALRQGTFSGDDSVLVFGAGPIGLLLAQWARAWGAARVLLADVDRRKLDFARTLGFDRLFDASTGDPAAWAREQTGGGADLVIEGSGASPALEQAPMAAKVFGRVVLLGNPLGEMRLSQTAYWAILRKELTVRGTWNSSFSDLPRNEWKLTLDSMASGKIDVRPLITHRVRLDELPGALAMLRDKTPFSNKVMYVNAWKKSAE